MLRRLMLILCAGLLVTPTLARAGDDSSNGRPKAARGEGSGSLAFNGNAPVPGTYQGTFYPSPGDQSGFQNARFTYQITDGASIPGAGNGQNCSYATFTLTIVRKGNGNESRNGNGNGGGKLVLAGSGTDCLVTSQDSSTATSIQNFTYYTAGSDGCYQQWQPASGTGNLTSTTNFPADTSTYAAHPNAGANPLYKSNIHLDGNLLSATP